MALKTLHEVISSVDAEKRGVGMFNVVGVEYAEAIIQAAEEENFPVMLGFPGSFFAFHPKPVHVVNMMLDMAASATVPVVVHLDHGANYDVVMQALRWGFSSVMFDGSSLPFEENIRQTAEIARVAHSMGASIEGELGYLGFGENVVILEDNLTKPEQAAEYVERTQVDALAVAIGNIHGHYKGTPHLDLERLAAIRKATNNCALVLHGGSGLSTEDFQNAILGGVRKVNIFTNMNDVAGACITRLLAEKKPWHMVAKEMQVEVKDLLRTLIHTFARL